MSVSIAIDGPAGAGKSTIAKRIAEKLGYIYVDTGAMYRAIGILFSRLGVSAEDEEEAEKACRNVDISIVYEGGEQQVIMNGENVTGLLRSENAGYMASVVSRSAAVRKKLVELQQKLAAKENVVMDGRDIGTVVLPAANLKIYLTADTATRAKRRFKELTEKGINCDIADIEKDITERDHKDMNRDISPLKMADDAHLVDSSDMSEEEVADSILKLLENIK